MSAGERRLDERLHVEKPLLDQLDLLGWEIIDLDSHQRPQDSHRQAFTDVVMVDVLRQQLLRINAWLEDDQIDEVVKRITASFPSTNLLENNKYVFDLLTANTSVAENRSTGDKSPTVRYIDFERPQENRYIAVCQFKVRILGTEHHIIPDIVLFVNGLPLVVIECKSPKVLDAIPEAIDQLLRYSEQRGARGEGSAPLFFFNQLVVVTSRQEAKFGTITTHGERHFYRWADPYPRTLDDLEHGASGPNDQQRLVAGMFDHSNLLDLVRTFTLFSVDDKGASIKIVGRYQQFRAVKLAVERLLKGKTPSDRSGIVWHTQGSGKSFTMMFMVREMYRHSRLSNWKVVFVTDRTQLETQLTATSRSIGFTVKLADSIDRLKQLLRSDTSDLVMAMIHKFRETEVADTFPILNSSPNILVMTDEAHRSVYRELGANLDHALPNAARIGYTGTPIEKTEQVFGDYIDTYTMRQAVEDKVTLEIVYEGRTTNAEVSAPAAMDVMFEDVFSDYNIEERLQVLGFGSRVAYLEAEPIIEAKARDMVEHYLTHVFPNGYKAQVVATSREAAVRYKKYIDIALEKALHALQLDNPHRLDLDTLAAMRTDVIISGRNNDLPHLKAYAVEYRHQDSIKRFKLRFGVEEEGLAGDVGFLIVNNMLLTGFDAPVEQVMYLDRVVVAHNLLQAIARVNRVAGDSKERGFVVDYVGVGHHLKRALDRYDALEQADIRKTLHSPDEELHELQQSHASIMRWLHEHGLGDLGDFDAFFDLFYDGDLRLEYLDAFQRFTRALNVVLPSKGALDYVADYRALSEVCVLASKHYRDAKLSMKGMPDKLRPIVDAHLESRGVDVKVPPISIFDDAFESDVESHASAKTRAAAVEHAIRHHLEVELGEDPDLQASFAEAVADILTEFRENWDQIYAELEKLRERIRAASQEPTYGLDRKKQMPFFRRLKSELYGDAELSEDEIGLLVDLTQQISMTVHRELRLTGFWESLPSRKKLMADIQAILLSPRFIGIPGVRQKRQQVIARVMEIAERNDDIIKYA